MRVRLLQPWIGQPIGEEMDLSDAKAKRLIKTKLVEKVKTAKNKPERKESDA